MIKLLVPGLDLNVWFTSWVCYFVIDILLPLMAIQSNFEELENKFYA